MKRKETETQSVEYPSVQEMTDDQQIGIIKGIFASITDKYDFLNRFLSVYQDVAWRKRAVSEMNFFNSYRFLDVATGTGDLALDCANTYENVNVTGVDFVEEMVDKGIEKVGTQNLNDRISLTWGDATNLAFEDSSFDVVIAINTLHNLDKEDFAVALREVERVSRKGAFVTVDAFRNEEEKEAMLAWNLTAKTILSVDEWIEFYDECGYTGDYYWCML